MQTTVNVNQYVIFRIGTEEYGINIQKVTTIERLLNITRVPHVSEMVKGVVNLRGEIIPVIELARRLKLEPSPETEDTRIIFFKIDDLSVGFIVDEVIEVLNISDDQIENISQVSTDTPLDYVIGIGKLPHKIVTLLDLDKLIILK